MTVKFFKINKNFKIITGGHKYDKMAFDCTCKTPDLKVQYGFVGADKNLPKFLWPFYEFFKGLKESNCDVIIINSSWCLRLLPLVIFLKLYPKRKTYAIHHHFIYLEFSGIKRFVYKNAEKFFLKWSDKIIVPSPYIYDELKNYKKEKDLLLWRIPFETKNEFISNPIPGNLTYTGTIEPRKGLIYLLKALKHIQDLDVEYSLSIVGKITNEAYYKQLKEFIETHNLKVKFPGFVELEEKNKILSETDIFVFPSLLEGFGMVLVEAQVFGLPIVSFDNSAMPFTVKDNVNGFAVTTGDYIEMAKRIQQIIENRSLRDRLSKGAIGNLKDQWSNQKFEETIIDYFTKLNSKEKKI